MKTIHISIFLLFICLILLSGGVNALSNAQKGAILKDFKKKEYELLFESNIGNIDSEDASILNVGKRLNLYSSIRDKVASNRENTESKHEHLITQINSLETSIATLDSEIEQTSLNISKINARVIEVKEEIGASEKTILLLRKKIEENREILLKYLVYIYKKSNSAYGEDDIDNLKSIILNDESIADIIDDLYFKGIIQVTGKKLIDKHRRFVSELYFKQLHLEKEEAELKRLRKTEIIERKIIKDKKEFKEKILSVSKGREALYKKFITDKIEVEKKLKIKEFKEQIKFNNIKNKLLDKYGCEFVDVSKNTLESRTLSEDCLNLNKLIYSESQLKTISPDALGNIFSWPILPGLGVSAYFSDAGYIDAFGEDHDAIDIVARQGTLIKAPMDGYVTHIQPADSEEYAFVAIKHSGGFTTVYGHVSEIMVQPFDFVKKGQIFAKSGGEYGTPGAGFLTTGPHLHFEIFQNKEYKDPLNYLDVSYLSYDYLPEKYRFKFYNDFKARRGYDFTKKKEEKNLFKIEGDSEVERQKYLLNRYARSDFRDWNMWVEESLDGNIDPTFVMCIGLAESGLGANMKTPYNVGNVGNTDSGAVKSFNNPRTGIYRIIKTLNNRYLSQYNTINKLSCYGNDEAKLCDPKKPVGHFVYASSPDHWHNNITKCMSHVKGRYIRDDYKFRIIK